MKLSRLSVLIFASAISAGCAGSDRTYTAPPGGGIENEIIVDRPFEETWDITVAKLAESFFSINNISRESRIINLSFRTDKPQDFVDCGKNRVTSRHPLLGEDTWVYEVAGPFDIWLAVDGTNQVYDVTRRSDLEGRINIFMAPQSARTRASANATYALTMNHVERGRNFRHNEVDKFTFDFTSKNPSSDGRVTCKSRGVLEKMLLDMVRGQG